MITHIKRSIPDLRNIKHQPLENKESPAGSPKHVAPGNTAGSSTACKLTNARPNAFVSEFGGENAFDNSVTLSAVQTTNCQVCMFDSAHDVFVFSCVYAYVWLSLFQAPCGPAKVCQNENTVIMQTDKAHCKYNQTCL